MDADYGKITDDLRQELRRMLPLEMIADDPATLIVYGQDESEKQSFVPELVIRPRDTQQVSQVARFCNKHLIPLTVRGGGTGLSGGVLPVYGGIVLAMEKMNKIVEIDVDNLQVTVEAGVVTQVLQEQVAERGLFYPPDPSSRGSCMIGGNLAENAGGTTAVKYGVTKDYVLSLEVVLANGEVIQTGANTLKNVTGYNLTYLMIGSEGTLGIITKAVLRLIPRPIHSLVMLAPFRSAGEAARAVTKILTAGIVPCAIEFMEADAVRYALAYLGEGVSPWLDNHTQAHLLIELDGNREDALMEEAEKIYALLEAFDCGEILLATTTAQKQRLKRVRASIGEAVTREEVYKKLDTVVPRARLPEQLAGVKEIEKKYGFRTLCFGHAGDGNMHVNILTGGQDRATWEEQITSCVCEVFELTVGLGGTLTAEHGIGYTQMPYLGIALSEKNIELQKNIKKLFDPNLILNPGKIFN